VAHSKSALKRLRQNERHRERNKAIRSATRTAVKQARVAADAGESNAADEVRAAASALDKAAKRHVVHRNAVARHKSRLARRLNRAGAGAVAEAPPKKTRKAATKKSAAKPRKTAAKKSS
jgi:small subunit ribosomal protein S20